MSGIQREAKKSPINASLRYPGFLPKSHDTSVYIFDVCGVVDTKTDFDDSYIFHLSLNLRVTLKININKSLKFRKIVNIK